MRLNSLIFRDIFGDPEVRAIWSDENRTQRYMDFEAALARAQASVGMIPKEAAAEITRVCKVENIDWVQLEKETLNIGYPVLGVVHQIAEHCQGDAAITAIGALRRRISRTPRPSCRCASRSSDR